MIIPMGASYYFQTRELDLYQAKATVIVGPGVFQDLNPDRRELDLSNTLAAAYAELVTQRSVLEPVIDALGLDRTPEELAEQIQTRIRSGAQLLEIQVTDTDRLAAALIANRLADELIRRSPTSEQNSPEQEAFIESQLEELEAKIEKTSQQIDELTISLAELTSAAEIQEAEERIEALELVESRYQDTYAQLLSVSRAESPNELALFEPARVPDSPIPRRTKLVVAVAGAAGVGLALSAVLLMEYLDTSLRWDLHGGDTTLGLPVLGAIPKVSSRGPIQRGHALSPAAEGVRAIRSKLFLMRPDDFFQTLALTSPGESEGKSFVLANLAVALASGGNQVIAVDGDMRRPSLHGFFDRPNLSGLAEVLSDGDAAEEQYLPIPLQETGFDGLHLLSAGQPPGDPAALLTSSRFERLLDVLTEEGDIILIDSPPLLGSPDATIIATRTEGTILVVSAGITRRESARQARDMLREQHGVDLLGLAFNRAELNKDYYYYYDRAPQDQEPWWRRWTRELVEDDWLTLDEAATRLGISRRQARRWCREGRLPASKRAIFWWQVKPEGLDRAIEDTLGPKQNGKDGMIEDTLGAKQNGIDGMIEPDAESPRYLHTLRG
jgi:capsular exopolysaccharide synthesis family protein